MNEYIYLYLRTLQRLNINNVWIEKLRLSTFDIYIYMEFEQTHKFQRFAGNL
jgi:hypothetical protein